MILEMAIISGRAQSHISSLDVLNDRIRCPVGGIEKLEPCSLVFCLLKDAGLGTLPWSALVPFLHCLRSLHRLKLAQDAT